MMLQAFGQFIVSSFSAASIISHSTIRITTKQIDPMLSGCCQCYVHHMSTAYKYQTFRFNRGTQIILIRKLKLYYASFYDNKNAWINYYGNYSTTYHCMVISVVMRYQSGGDEMIVPHARFTPPHSAGQKGLMNQ